MVVDASALEATYCNEPERNAFLGAILQAVAAFARYGRRTPAALNLGDCFAYALAQRNAAPLLYKGLDFVKTGIASAG